MMKLAVKKIKSNYILFANDSAIRVYSPRGFSKALEDARMVIEVLDILDVEYILEGN